ncbi:ATP-binding cassette domain-containing protein [Chloroflexi bacterium TSY]|nr:ATP-binding cassette domain-containing protein [Chloroflexi bacterium TSY]
MPWDLLLVGTATAVLIASSGILYFQRTERIFPAYRTNFFGCDITMSDIAIRDDDYMSDIIWALNDVSFEVKRGEVVGLIGRNGAGKSTLLKILSRVTHPSRGQIELYGRLASLLEVGTGFHPELTGRENIYMNSAILGMKKAEIDRKFDEIVDFSGVEKFIDTPVKRYSSGMRARLGFSVAAYLESEIMIVDEVLSVGDVAFRRKSQDKMRNAAQTGRTVLFVSHNLTMISALCQRVLYLKNGKLEIDADTEKSIARYVMDMENLTQTPLSERTGREGSGHVQITNLRWLDAKTLSPLECVRTGQEVYLEISYETASIHQKVMDSLEVNISIRTELDQVVIVLNSRLANNAFDQRLPSTGQLYCHLERFPLMTGRYFGQYAIRLNGILADRVRNAFTLEVELGDFFGTGQVNHGIRQSVCVPQTWLVDI